MNVECLQWQVRCEFNAYCRNTIRNELVNARKEMKRRRRRRGFCVGGLKITARLLAQALHALPEEKKEAILLYYFFNMSDVEIARQMKIPRSTVQYRSTSSFEKLKHFLEERADEWDKL